MIAGGYYYGVVMDSLYAPGADFSGALIVGSYVDATENTLAGADFSDATIRSRYGGIDFSYSDMQSATFSGASIEATGWLDFSESDMSNGDFNHVHLESDFRGIDLSYAILQSADFSGAFVESGGEDLWLIGADLSGADFTDSRLKALSASSNYHQGPAFIDIDDSNLASTDFTSAKIKSGGGIYLRSDYAPYSTFKDATLTAGRSGDGGYGSISFYDSLFFESNFKRANLKAQQAEPDAKGDGVYFIDANLMGSDFTKATVDAPNSVFFDGADVRLTEWKKAHVPGEHAAEHWDEASFSYGSSFHTTMMGGPLCVDEYDQSYCDLKAAQGKCTKGLIEKRCRATCNAC
jgi:uncharacterized protein YjbI with pentapeptide repeats